MTRGHRLVFSNGILFLAAAGIITLLGTGGRVSRLIPLYAIGVFTSFTLSQAGMAKHHTTHKEPGWKVGLFINATGAVLSALVLAIVAVVKFTGGAWVIMILIPLMVLGLVRLNRAYESEAEELVSNAPAAAAAPALRRHVVVTLVDKLDMATARAIQYSRSLRPTEFRAVHFDLDPWKTHLLTDDWRTLGFQKIPLDIIECPDRRVPRAAADVVLAELAGGDTEVSVLVPRREYERAWHRALHDRSSDAIGRALGAIPHCNVTIVPYHLGSERVTFEPKAITEHVIGTEALRLSFSSSLLTDTRELPDDRVLIAAAAIRSTVRVAGRVRALRVQPFGGNPSLEATVADESGEIVLVFTGRRAVAGIGIGTILVARGAIANRNGHRTMLNPLIDLVKAIETPHAPTH